MVYTKEEKAAYDKEYRLKYKERRKALNIKNREHILLKQREYNTKHKEKKRIQHKNYGQTPQGKRSTRISGWKSAGVIGDLSKFYDEKYITATNCDVCNKEFSTSYYRCLDHCHTTGEIRQILCRSCNNHDSWRLVIEK